MRRALSSLWVSLPFASALAIACGGNPPKEPDNATKESAKADAGAPAPAASADAGAATAAPPASLDSQREPFVALCMKKMPEVDYCECAWNEFKGIFKPEDLSKAIPDTDPRFDALKEQTRSKCGGKLTEPTVKKAYLDLCGGDDPKKKKFCECGFTSLRKKLALSDFVQEQETPHMVEARTAMAKECKGTLPMATVKVDFMKGCTRNEGERTKLCECLFKKITAKYSSEEIGAGAMDPKNVPGLDTCNKDNAKK